CAMLFMGTESLPAPSPLLCRRRPRARDQKPIWALHFLAGPERADSAVGEGEYETDRAKLLGRGSSAAARGRARSAGERGEKPGRPAQISGAGPFPGPPPPLWIWELPCREPS